MVGKLRAQTGTSPKKAYNEWTVLDAYNSIEAEERAAATTRKAKSTQMKFKQTLDGQVEALKGKKPLELEEEKKYLAKQGEILEEWKRGQQKVQLAIQAKIDDEKRAREGQIRERNERMKKEAAAKRAAEVKELEICAAEIERQEAIKLELKLQEKERFRKIQLENAKEQIVRQKRREVEAAEDQRLMEEYKQRLEQQEIDRANAFKNRMAKLEASGSKWAEEGAGKEKMDTEKKIEEMVMREAAAKEAADMERERRDKAALKHNAKLMAETNKRLMDAKKARESARQEDETSYALQYRTEGETYQRQEVNRKAAMLEKMKAHQAVLQEQIARKKAVDKFAMSNSERKINAVLLNKLTNDPVFMRKLEAKLSTPSRQGRAQTSGSVNSIGRMG